MYPCCIIIALVLLGYWGAKDKATVLWRRFKLWVRKKRHPEEAEQIAAQQKTLKEELKEAQRETAVFKRNKEGYSDGRTKIIDLRKERTSGTGDEET